MTPNRNHADQSARVHRMPFGAEVQARGAVRFRIFAPGVDSLQLQLNEASPLRPLESEKNGWRSLTTADASAGTRYRFVLPDGTRVPDPASRFQPEDVHGPSEVIDPAAYLWRCTEWTTHAWEESVLYELHVGTFTSEGTFQSALKRLDHLAELGVTGIELMALADFAGNRNWGYDDVLLYAPDSAYGRPEDMKAFIDGAHARGMMIILDVVYSHFGPEGNYLSRYFPQLCSDRHTTPWGPALNFDGPGSGEVREFIIQNALYWLEEFQIDGLRLDASHEIIDEGPTHLLDELRERIKVAVGERRVHLVLEHEQNISERLERDGNGLAVGYTAQWNHDITHLLAALLGKSCEQRRDDDGGETDKLGRALARGFVIAADESGKALVRNVPPAAFIAFIQTHDLIGNRVFGDRIHGLTSTEAERAIAAILLLSPQVPLLFMGQEWAASTPFPYFCDYHGSLADAVRRGRCEQLQKQDPAPSADELSRAPDPQAESTFRSAQLRWEESEHGIHSEWLAWYKRILAVRREQIIPLLSGLSKTSGEYQVISAGLLRVSWELRAGKRLHLAANLCATETENFPETKGEVIWIEGSQQGTKAGPWSVRWSIENC